MSAKNWTREMNKMLANVENEVTNALYNIDQSGHLLDAEFKAYFFESLNDRLTTTYSKVEKELKMKKTFAGASTHSAHVKCESDNDAQNVIEIDDSSDEEDANQTAQISDKSVQEATTLTVSSVNSSDANAHGRDGRFDKGQGSGTSTTVSGSNVFRIGSTVIRRRQSNAGRNEPPRNYDDELVGLGADISENDSQQNNEQEATNAAQNHSPMDFGGENPMVNDGTGASSVYSVLLNNTNAAKNFQSNPTTRTSNKNAHKNKATVEKVATKSAKQEASKHVNTNEFKCRLCDYVGRHMGVLNRHMRTHTGEKPYRCDRCGKRFSRKEHLKKHATIHTDVFPFHCKGCLRTFAQKSEKDAHDKVCKLRRYECHLCKKFVTHDLTTMKRHMRSHTGEKPFRCEVCMKRFTQKGSLNQHLDNVHSRNYH